MDSNLKPFPKQLHTRPPPNNEPKPSLETMKSLLDSLLSASPSPSPEPSLRINTALVRVKANNTRRFQDRVGNHIPTTKNVANMKKQKSPRQLQEFHPFPRLPLEIRQMIWRETFPAPRQLLLMTHVHGKNMTPVSAFGPRPRTMNQFVPSPIAYNVNHDGRSEVLSHYEPLLTSPGPNGQPRIQKSVLFNPKVDTMYLSWDDCIVNPPDVSMCSDLFSPNLLKRGLTLEQLSHAGLHAVQTLILGQKGEMMGESSVDLTMYYPRYLELFTGLEELRLAKSEIGAVVISMRQLVQCASSILRYFQEMKVKNPEVKIPVITFWDMEENPEWTEMQRETRQAVSRLAPFSGLNAEANKNLQFPVRFVDRFCFRSLD